MNEVLKWLLCCAGIAAIAGCSNFSAMLKNPQSSHTMPSSGAAKVHPPSRNSATVSTASLQDQPDRLIGLDGAQLRDLLGQPIEEEDQAPAKLWRFRYAGCTLDILLYPDVQTQTFRSLNYEVTGDDGSDKGKHQCAKQLQSRTSRK